jgi:hypothetical protein
VAFCVAKKEDMYYFNTKALKNNINGQPTNSEIIAFDVRTNQFIPLFDKILPDEENQSWDFNNGFIINSQGDIFFSIAWQNQCYRIENKAIYSLFSIDVGSQAVPDEIKKGTYDQKVKYLDSSPKNKFLFFKLFISEGNNFILSCVKGYKPSVSYFYIHYNGKDYFTNRIRNDFMNDKIYWNLDALAMDKDYIFSVIAADDPSALNKNYLDYFNMDSEENPVVLLYKFKN